MSNNSKLLVPMYLEALVLRGNKTDCVDISPQLNLYNQSILGNVFRPNTKAPNTLEKGVHLHWTLPKALKHSFLEEGEEMKFPYAPNRWMVTRIQTNEGIQNMPSRMWMIESDKQLEDQNKPNWVSIKDHKFAFRSIGKKSDWTGYKASSSETTLTAVNAANPFFASFYPSCRNVFGFHDDLSDITTDGTLTYMVTGWYSDPATDPIAPLGFTVPITNEQKKRKRELDWFQEHWKCTALEYPTSSLLHATMHSISWNDSLKSGVPDGPVQVYAGNTAVEALSAQILHSSDKEEPGMEELLNALQYQLLDDQNDPPSLSTIKNEIHKRGFSPQSRGVYWEVHRKETEDKQLEKTKESKPQFPKDLNLLSELKKLNRKQIQANVVSQKILSLRQEYYFLWYKQASKTVNGYEVSSFDNKAYEEARKKIIDPLIPENGQLGKLQKKRNTLKTEIETSKTNLKKYKALAEPNAEFELKEKLEDRFWEPNEPVLLLCGTGIGNTDKPIFQTGSKGINCRTLSQVLTELKLEVPKGKENIISVAISAASFSIAEVDQLSSDSIPAAAIKILAYESLLFDQALSMDIALLAYQKAGLGEGKNKENSPAIKKFAKDTVIPAQALLPSPKAFFIHKWQQAWSPLFLSWEVAYSPINETLDNLDLIDDTDNWTLEDGLFYKNKRSTAQKASTRFSGISPFSNAVFANLKRVLPDKIVNKYGELNLIAQSLSGLHKFLLMQRPDIQLPPLKYASEWGGLTSDYLIDQEELDLIGPDAYLLGCDPGIISGKDPNLFFPLRTGLLQVVNLSIVDVFGQIKKVIIDQADNNPSVKCSVSIQGETNQNNTIPLAPKMIQASRLQFQWLNALEEIIYQDAGKLDNPVLAWLVPNYLDKSILVYEGDGKEVAILQVTTDISKDKGLNLSKIPFPGSNDIPDLAHNPQLKQFLEAIDKASIVSGIMDLASKINLNLSGAQAMQNNPSALLCGQPIALARCAVSLEHLGLPAYNQRWDQSGKENSGGIASVKFPLLLGDFNNENDGLLGYFQEADYSQFYTTINAPEFKFSESEPLFKKNSPVKLSIDKGPVKLTLLIDPSAGVHLSTGILPTKKVELYAHLSNELLASLNTSFMVAPFIAEKVEPGIPVPLMIDAQWKWTHKSDVTTWQKEADIPEGKNKELAAFKKQQVYEGWLKLSKLKTNNK